MSIRIFFSNQVAKCLCVRVAKWMRVNREYISKVKDGLVDKIGVLKNNKLNAVIVSVEEYEKMSEAMNLLADMNIHEEIQSRLTSNRKLLDGNDVLKKHGLSLDV